MFKLWNFFWLGVFRDEGGDDNQYVRLFHRVIRLFAEEFPTEKRSKSAEKTTPGHISYKSLTVNLFAEQTFHIDKLFSVYPHVFAYTQCVYFVGSMLECFWKKGPGTCTRRYEKIDVLCFEALENNFFVLISMK